MPTLHNLQKVVKWTLLTMDALTLQRDQRLERERENFKIEHLSKEQNFGPEKFTQELCVLVDVTK